MPFVAHLDILLGKGENLSRDTDVDVYLAYVDSLVPLINKLDGKCPVVITRCMSHSEPLILGEGARTCAQYVPVS